MPIVLIRPFKFPATDPDNVIVKRYPTTQKDKLEAEQDDYLEEALEETFPASAPISWPS